MSRIAGFISWPAISPDPEARATVDGMLSHMVPGARRIIDTDCGPLGLAGDSGDVAAEDDHVLVMDGRLLDRDRLLPGPGGDAAALLRLCREAGFAAAMQHIDGDVAVAYWDPVERRLWLGRDRMGVKPLYYARMSRGIAFASQPAPLAALADVGSTVNRRFAALVAGSHYRTFDNAPEESPFAAVSQLPAAHVVAADPGSIRSPSPYWRLEPVALPSGDETVLAEQYADLLFRAVERRLAVARRPAFTLSGGMDSSSVLSTATKLTGRPQAAFSSVYADPTYDERAEIQDVLDAGLAHWTPVELADDMDILAMVNRLVRVHNEPVATATWLSHDIVCGRVAAAGHEALFGGLGGDELNAGEYEYFPLFFADLQAAGKTAQLEQELEHWARYHDHPVHRKSPEIGRRMMKELTLADAPGRCLPNRDRQMRYSAAVLPSWHDLSTFEPVMEHPFQSYLANRAFQDLTRETTPCCLRAEDRQCVAHGLDHFDPFLDRALVEFMFSVPADMKIRHGITKHLLRKATQGVLPDATRNRVKKTGWNAPAHVWFSSGRGLQALNDLVASQQFRERGLYNVTEVKRLIAEHTIIVQSGQAVENHMMFLWQLLNMECWLRWIDEGMPTALAP